MYFCQLIGELKRAGGYIIRDVSCLLDIRELVVSTLWAWSVVFWGGERRHWVGFGSGKPECSHPTSAVRTMRLLSWRVGRLGYGGCNCGRYLSEEELCHLQRVQERLSQDVSNCEPLAYG